MGDLPIGDKVAHLGLYTVLGAALAWGRLRTSGASPPHLLLVLLGMGYGLVDEVHQAYVPGRDPSAGDVLADTVGVLLGYSVFLILFRSSALTGAED